MENNIAHDVLIIGGSYSGLSAALALARSRRQVLIIDNGKPCNRQTPHAHNLITHDGETPASIAANAREQVLAYPGITILDAEVQQLTGSDGAFEASTREGKVYGAKKVLIAAGIRDEYLPIPGFDACWGISILHCPYCHGYEVRDLPLGVIGNGDMGFEFAKMIHHWSAQLTLFTNGPSNLQAAHVSSLEAHGIAIVEKEIAAIEHTAGEMSQLRFTDGSAQALKAVFTKCRFEESTGIPAAIGCEFQTEGMVSGLLKVNNMGGTTIPGIYAAGDNCSPMRSLANAIATGNLAGAAINRELISASF